MNARRADRQKVERARDWHAIESYEIDSESCLETALKAATLKKRRHQNSIHHNHRARQ